MRSRWVQCLSAAVTAALVAGCGGADSSESGDDASPCEPENLVWVYGRITEPENHSYPSTIFRYHRGSETALASDDAEAPSLSPDGGRVVFERGSEGDPESAGYARIELYAMDSDGSGEELLLAEEDPVTTDDLVLAWDRHPVWSPDGTNIAFVRNTQHAASDGSRGGNHQVMVVSVADGRARPLPGGTPDRYAPAPAWSADGSRLAWITGGPTLAWSSLDGRDRREVRLDGEPTSPPAWIDGDRAIVVRLGERLYRIDAATGTQTDLDLPVALRALWAMPTGQLAGLDGPEERSRLVVVDMDGSHEVHEIATLEGSRILPEGSVADRTRGPVTAAPATPDGWASCLATGD
jgi:hypothetical protein